MATRTKILAATTVVVLVAALIAGAANGAKHRTAAVPGVTSNSITLGGLFPFTGAAAAYGTIARSEQAYFSWYNDTHGGVYHRKIVFKTLDDAYVPAQAAQLIRQLVEQDHIFAAFGNLGTEPNIAMQDYLKSRGVPNLFVATGASQWGTQHAKYPMQIGYQPDYVTEGKAYGQYLRKNVPNAKIGILEQNDAYGADYLKGIRLGLGNKKSRIIHIEKYQLTDTDQTPFMSKLKASGANVFIDIATPGYSIPALAAGAKLGWNPSIVIVNNVASPDLYMKIAARLGAGKLVDQALSVVYGIDPGDPRIQNTAVVKQYKSILAKYCSTCRAGDAFNTYGFGEADLMVKTLLKAGKNPTRASLVHAADNVNTTLPYLLKGVRVTTSQKCHDYFPVSQLRLAKYSLEGGYYTPIGPLVNGRPRPKHAKC